jgi:hypothetical protein
MTDPDGALLEMVFRHKRKLFYKENVRFRGKYK